MPTEQSAPADQIPDRHPSGLPLLLAAMAAYRFSTTAVFTLLFLQLSTNFGLSYAKTGQIYSAITAMTYIGLPLCGLWADRELGCRPAMMLGVVLMGLSGLLLSIGVTPVFFAGLLLFTLGSIFFRAGHAPLLGQLYGTDATASAHRETAFILDMLLVSVGSLFAPALASVGGSMFGCGPIFGLAGLFQLITAAVLWAGRRQIEGLPAQPSTEERWQGVVGLGAALVLLCEGALHASERLLLDTSGMQGQASKSLESFAILLLSAAAAALLVWLFEGLRRRGVALGALTRLGAGVLLTAVLLGGVRLLLWRGILSASLSARAMLGMPLQLPGLLLLPVWMSLVCQRAPRRMQATLLALLAVGIQLLATVSGLLLTSHR